MKNQLLTSLSTRDKIYQAAWAWYQDYMRVLTLAFNSQRVGMSVILILFGIGGLLLLPVKVENDGFRTME